MSIASSLRPAAQLDWSVVLIDLGPDRSMCCAVPPRRSSSTCSLSHDHVLLTSLGCTLSAAILERLGVVRTDFNAREGRTSATADLRSARTTRPHAKAFQSFVLPLTATKPPLYWTRPVHPLKLYHLNLAKLELEEDRGAHRQLVIFGILELASRNVIRGCLPLLE